MNPSTRRVRPMPSWPTLLLPEPITAPSAPSASVCSAPHATCRTGCRRGTRSGRGCHERGGPAPPSSSSAPSTVATSSRERAQLAERTGGTAGCGMGAEAATAPHRYRAPWPSITAHSASPATMELSASVACPTPAEGTDGEGGRWRCRPDCSAAGANGVTEITSSSSLLPPASGDRPRMTMASSGSRLYPSPWRSQAGAVPPVPRPAPNNDLFDSMTSIHDAETTKDCCSSLCQAAGQRADARKFCPPVHIAD